MATRRHQRRPRNRRARAPAPAPRPWSRPAVWAPAAIVVLVPLAMEPGGYFIFLPVKLTLATVLVPVGVAVAVARRDALARTPALAAWLAFLLVLVVAAALGHGGITSWIGSPGRGLGVMAWLVFGAAFWLGSSLRAREDRSLVVLAASAGSILVSAYALLQAVDLDPLAWAEHVDTTRTRSTLGNPAFLGAYLAMVVPLAGRLALSATATATGIRRERAVHAVAAGLAFVALLSTETRGAWLGALLGLVVVTGLEWPTLRAERRRRAGGLAAAAVILVLLATVSPFASRVRSIADPETATGRGRITQWGRTVEMIAERPVLGWGPDTYAFAFPQFIDARFERTVGRTVVPDRAHNVVLDVASATGLVGLAAYLAVLGAVAWSVLRHRPRDAVTVGLAGACAAYVGQLQFSFPLADLDAVFWLLAGMLVAPGAAVRLQPARRWAIVPAVAAAALVVWGTTDVVADRTLRRALEEEADGRFPEATDLVDEAARTAPGRVQYRQAAARLHGRVAAATGEPDELARALEQIERALDLVPRDLELALDRADLLLDSGEAAGDRKLLEQAAAQYEDILDFDPASSRAHLKVGVAYVQLGRAEAAEREWRTAASLSPRSPGPLVNLGLLYEQAGRTAEARRTIRSALALDPDHELARAALERLEP